MTDLNWYHALQGWNFRRDAEGNVWIMSPDSSGPGAKQIACIPPNLWASVVSTVSRRGETAETFHQAEKFHNGEPI